MEVHEVTKIGRPKAEEPKKNRVTVRFDDREFQKLKECAKKYDLTVTETVRMSVQKVLDSEQ